MHTIPTIHELLGWITMASIIARRTFHSTILKKNKVTTVFPGQGNVSPHLFKLTHFQIDVLKNPKYLELINHAQNIIPEIPLSSYFSKSTYPGKNVTDIQLSQTSFVQPLVLLASYLNYTIFNDMFEWDVKKSDYILGHSLGELTGLVVQEAITLEDGLIAAYKRGKLMEEVLMKNEGKEWGMYALMFRERDFESVYKICEDNLRMNIANVNGYDQIVVSGEIDELRQKLDKLDQIQKELLRLGQWKSRIKKVKLQTKIPAHHPIFEEMKQELRDSIRINLDKLNVPVVCNLNGFVVTTNTERVVDNFIDVTSKPVQFVKCLETIKNSNLNENLKFFNFSDVTYGLTNRFFKDDKSVEVYDLINEAEKQIVK